MSSRQEQEQMVEAQARLASVEAQSREAAREITHERTERARVVGEEGQAVEAEAGILETVQQSPRSFLGVAEQKQKQATKNKDTVTMDGSKQSSTQEFEFSKTARDETPEHKPGE